MKPLRLLNRHPKPKPKRHDLTNKRFGYLTITARASDYQSSGRAYVRWIARCDCGQALASNLTKGHVKSCGNAECSFALTLRGYAGEGVSAKRQVFCIYRARAKKKEIPFTLQRDEFVSLIQSDCGYCGGVPSNHARATKGSHRRDDCIYSGIDRIVPSLGYVKGNVTPCCAICNRMKGTLPLGQFLQHAQAISRQAAKGSQQ